MANTGPKTPPPQAAAGGDLVIKSTPNAVGTAVISDNIHTLGTNVDDLRQWIKRDIEEHTTCGIDEMLQELLYRCGDWSNSSSKQKGKRKSKEKKTLLKNVFDDVLQICDDKMKQEMKQHLSCFVKCATEPPSYEPFVRAANVALDRLSKVKTRGIVPFDDDDDRNILFHHNNMPIKQKHQGVESHRKPDVVVVSHATARYTMAEKHRGCEKDKLFSIACKQPDGRFEWANILTIFEFKRSANLKLEQPNYDNLKVSDPDTEHHMEYGKRSSKSAQPTGSASKELRRSARLMNSGRENKRPSDDQGSNERSSKRMKSNTENSNTEHRDSEKLTKKIDPMEQNGLYAAEMFATHVARQHVLSCVINNDMLYIWYFDRQDAIQSAGFNFIHDLPRFLVLLLIMQRLPYAGWGYSPLFDPEPGFSGKIDVQDDERNMTIDLEFDFHTPDCTTHYGLRGRATNVFPVKSEALSKLAKDLVKKCPGRNKTDELVAKIYWPEETRQSEDDILKEVHNIAIDHADVKDHVPDMVWSHKFEGTSTEKIREALGIDGAAVGSRSLFIIVFRKLRPVTELSGDEFLRAWWQAVLCHRILWKRRVRHRDVSPSNIMYYRDSSGKVVGVLNDYDLSSMNIVPSGRERTGTVPFMALKLLTTKAIEGKVEHLYQHDIESFVWVLTWVSLRYEDGKLRQTGRPFDDWLRVDAKGCHEKKSSFLLEVKDNDDDDIIPSKSHQSAWQIALACLRLLLKESYEKMDGEHVFQNLLCAQIPPSLRGDFPPVDLQ